jgi:hypothetical protein
VKKLSVTIHAGAERVRGGLPLFTELPVREILGNSQILT